MQQVTHSKIDQAFPLHTVMYFARFHRFLCYLYYYTLSLYKLGLLLDAAENDNSNK